MKKILMTIMTIGVVAGIGLAGCGKQENEATASTENRTKFADERP